jgi:cytoskeletal protein CcmA (bactofilin family)
MARESTGAPPESVISIIGPGMKVVGDCHTDGTLRVEGTVEGSLSAAKAVVVGKQGVVRGNITTQDAVISGRVDGTLVAESRLELQATCHVEGEVKTRRMQLEEGAVLNGTIQMGDAARARVASEASGAVSAVPRPPSEGEGAREPAVAAPRKA